MQVNIGKRLANRKRLENFSEPAGGRKFRMRVGDCKRQPTARCVPRGAGAAFLPVNLTARNKGAVGKVEVYSDVA
jgi:hypothetical protein